MKRASSVFCISILLTSIIAFPGCASSPDSLGTTSVSPLLYSQYSCDQIVWEADRVSRRSQDLYQSLDNKADNDAVQMAVGLVLLWPVLFALEGGDGPEAAEYSRLKGEAEALERAAIHKNCNLQMMPKGVVAGAPGKKEEVVAAKPDESAKKPNYSAGSLELEECAEFTTC